MVTLTKCLRMGLGLPVPFMIVILNMVHCDWRVTQCFSHAVTLCKTTIGKGNLVDAGPNMWNSLPKCVRSSGTLASFPETTKNLSISFALHALMTLGSNCIALIGFELFCLSCIFTPFYLCLFILLIYISWLIKLLILAYFIFDLNLFINFLYILH